MGNCQTAEAAPSPVVIQHTGGPPYKVERLYRPISSLEVMGSNPGHYVALLTISRDPSSATPPAQRLKLLRPSDTLHLGSIYRLIPFEDVLKEFESSKKVSVKFEKLLKDGSEKDTGRVEQENELNPDPMSLNESGYGFGCRSGVRRRLGQWRPALQSIAEVGNS